MESRDKKQNGQLVCVLCPRYNAVAQQKNKGKCKSSATVYLLFRQSGDSSFLIQQTGEGESG